MREKSGKVPSAASCSNSLKGTKLVANRSLRRSMWMNPVNEIALGSSTYTFQVLPTCSSRLKIVSARLWRMKFAIGRFTTKPDDVAAVQNDRLGIVWEGTSLNQWSNTPKFRANVISTGTCSGVH